jgi:hypothetical protein
MVTDAGEPSRASLTRSMPLDSPRAAASGNANSASATHSMRAQALMILR